MAEADSISSSQEETSPTPSPVAEPTAPPESTPPAVTEPENVPVESPPAHTEPTADAVSSVESGDAVQSETAQTRGFEPFPIQSEPLLKPEETPSEAKESPRARSIKGNARKQERKREKIEKLLTEIQKRGKISNDEVEKLLRVSDATATRYLSELEKEGKIRQVGKTGRGVAYERNSF